MVFAGLLTIDTFSANPAPAGVACAAAFDPVQGVPRSDNLAVREASAGEFLSLLGMLLEEIDPPAQSPAMAAASTAPPTPGPAEEVSPETDFSAERSKLAPGVAQSPIPVLPALVEMAPVEMAPVDPPPAAIGSVRPAAEAPAPAPGEGPRAPVESRVSAAETGGTRYQPAPDADLAFALRLSRRQAPEAGLPALRTREGVVQQSPLETEFSSAAPVEIPTPAPETPDPLAAPTTGSSESAGISRTPPAEPLVVADRVLSANREVRPAELAPETQPVDGERPAEAEPVAPEQPADPGRRAAAASPAAFPADRKTEAGALADPNAMGRLRVGPKTMATPSADQEPIAGAVPRTEAGPRGGPETKAGTLAPQRTEAAPSAGQPTQARPLVPQRTEGGLLADLRTESSPPAGLRISPAPRQPSRLTGAGLESGGRDRFSDGQAGDRNAAGEPVRRRPAGVEDAGSEDVGWADASRPGRGSESGGYPEAEPSREVPALVFRPAESGAPPPAPGSKALAAGGARSEAALEPEAPGANPGQPARKISLQVSAPQSDRRVAVDLVDRGGKLHVAVRTPSEQLAGSLREGLPELVRGLGRSGYGAETWSPGAGRGDSRESAAERGSLGGDEARQQQGARQDPAPDRNPGGRERHPSEPAWLDQVRRKRQNSVEESFLWHLQSIR